MRSRPATGTALLRGMSCLSAPHRGEVYAANLHSRKDVGSSAHSANHLPCGSRSAATAEAGGSVLLLEEDSMRRPQRPGFQHAPKRALQPPGNSPSRIAGNRRLCRNLRQVSQDISRLHCSVLCLRVASLAIENSASLVKKLCRTGIACGKNRKSWNQSYKVH